MLSDFCSIKLRPNFTEMLKIKKKIFPGNFEIIHVLTLILYLDYKYRDSRQQVEFY